MRCIFLDSEGNCYAGLTYEEVKGRKLWQPDETTKKNYCTMNAFKNCPRFSARMNVLTKTT